ncbi:uncharacterized protein LOC115748214 [Rhodamnia argentea]|uniref:Uncharacterized protein LOC115748214 n=1 Tax=Rhodamnia argentea TaxID=178133 RepID=A0A8B8Q1X7_9MYRT|nr:uncharacterized protein LOC115748214 [Rhodamnia argentea]
MASLGVRCSGGECSMSRSHVPSRQIDHQSPWKPCALTIPKRTGSKTQAGGAVSALMPIGRRGSIPRKPKPYQELDEGTAIAHEKLDDWMEGSVVEIVRNLREAPLFVHVYDDSRSGGGGGGLDGESIRLRTEKRVREEDWDCVKMKWEKGEVQKPEGVIYVEELEDGENEQDNVNKIWGLVVQGKGANCRPACYLLETCRVGSGLGSVSTHFCLMKVKSFRESARSQLMKSWL